MIKIPQIDHDACTLCGRCIDVCPKKVLAVSEKKISVSVDECMLCSHCYTVCHYNAIHFDPDALVNLKFLSFPYSEKMIAPGMFSAVELVNFIRSRRSVRKFKNDPVARETISDLIEFAVAAPSGSNCQEWEFLAINGRDRVWELALEIKKFFVRLNRLAKNPFIRYLSVPVAGTALIRYHREHMDSVETALRESEAGHDLLFHSAPSVIILHSAMEGSTPVEDAQYAAYNMTLLGHALGLGTCFIGYAVESINRSAALKRYLGIPDGNRVTAVIALGYPDASFEKPALRKKFPLRFM
jgi:nitroreductase/NAD-dependent dihydropyrimidine dehydrogenase PreA subunit